MKRILMVSAVVLLLLVGLAPTAGAIQPDGPVRIWTVLDFSTVPFTGTFAVTQGAEILGCASGSFVDHAAGQGRGYMSSIVRKEFYCAPEPGEDGPDFVVKINANPSNPGPGDFNGYWVFWKGTGDFAGLRGNGEISVWFDFANERLNEEITGVVHYDP